MKRRVLCVASMTAALAAGAVTAQPAYPVKPVRLVVGFAPGGSVDVLGRLFAQRFAQTMGQQFVVDNRPGAGANIAGDLVAKSPPDGYTLLVGNAGGLGGNLAIYRRMPYDPFKDLTPIAQMVTQGNILIVHPSVPAKTVDEFVAIARRRAGALNAGTAGNGSSQHFTLAMFNALAKAQMEHVAYKGGAPAMADLMGGQIDAMFQTIPEAMPFMKDRRIRPIAVTMATRSPALPDIPTLAEAGLPGYEFEGFMGLVGPASLPREIVQRLNTEVNAALQDPATHNRLREYGFGLAGGTPEHLTSRMRWYTDLSLKTAKWANMQLVD